MQNHVVSVSSQAASLPFKVNSEQPNFKLGLWVSLTNTPSLTFSVQATPDDPKLFADQAAWIAGATWYPVTGLSAATATAYALLEAPCMGIRINVSTWVSGTASLTITQTY